MPTSEHRGHFGLSGQRFGDSAPQRNILRSLNCLKCFIDKRLVNRDAYALPSGVIVRYGFVTLVAVISKNQDLGTELNTIGGPDFGSVVAIARVTLLIVNRYNRSSFAFDQIHLGDKPMSLTAKIDGA